MGKLHPKPVIENASVPVPMFGAEQHWVFVGLRTVPVNLTEDCGEQISTEVGRHMPTRLVLSDRA